jgi:hypothetical protein
MSREPSYPQDAAIGAEAQGRGTEPGGSGGGEAARAAASAKTVKPGGAGRTKKIVAGAAIGIGSAAIVAALLYASRKSRNEG